MILVYIHGANATGNSFNYIRQKLKHNNELVLEYDSKDGFEHNLESMKSQLKGHKDIFFICHSLGGIYAVHLSNTFVNNVLGAVTLSTPYNGAEMADYAKRLMPFSKLLRDIGPSSDPIRNSLNMPIKHPWTNIVTTHGASIWINQPNDGVVTIKSMSRRDDMNLVEIQTNHYEVMLNDDVIDIIKLKIKEVTK
jgi:esterase/lipase